jgi:hypothetical protein
VLELAAEVVGVGDGGFFLRRFHRRPRLPIGRKPFFRPVNELVRAG